MTLKNESKLATSIFADDINLCPPKQKNNLQNTIRDKTISLMPGIFDTKYNIKNNQYSLTNGYDC